MEKVTDKLNQLIDEGSSEGRTERVNKFARKMRVSPATLRRLLASGKTSSLKLAVNIQRASGGAILPEELL